MPKKILLVLLLPIFVIGTFTYKSLKTITTPRVLPASISIDQATLIIDKYSVSLSLSDPQTALSLLTTAAKLQSLKLTTKQYDFGVLVEAIGDLANTSDKSWIYFVNGNSASVGADKYIVNPGDVIEWKYVKPQF
jgi:hypothetical protein